jgi:two-component system, response regulator
MEILLIEDNAEDVELTLRAFHTYRLADKVHVLRDGEEAMDCLFKTESPGEPELRAKPRLILLDLNLPKVSGLEILSRCKSDSRTKNIPVVVLTSSHEERDLVQSYDLGVNSYVVKPVDFSQFTEAIRHLGHYWMVINRLPSEFPGEAEQHIG